MLSLAKVSMSSAQEADLPWIEEQVCNGLNVSPAQFRAALDVPEAFRLTQTLLNGGESHYGLICTRP